MGFDYVLVHLKYSIPPAIALTILYRPLLTRTDLYKLAFLLTVAVVSTIPWDSNLIHRGVWTYPPSSIVGPTLFLIPAEELFFFVIQTYNTTLLYMLLSRPVFHPKYLTPTQSGGSLRLVKRAGQGVLLVCILVGGFLVRAGGKGTYLGLILTWAGPFALLLWTLSSQFFVSLPAINTFVPIILPTLYLWIVDTLALRNGTWAIASETKLGIYLWDGLEIEEAIFFFATNLMVVLGLVAFDHAFTIILTFPELFPQVPDLPSPVLLVQSFLVPDSAYDQKRVAGFAEAVTRLQKKSRSFYLASSTFSGRLRIDLILLYSFCRVADDLVDNAATKSEAANWIKKLTHYLDLAYASREARIVSKEPTLQSFISANFPDSAQSALRLLPTHLLYYGPLYELLEGFKTDLEYSPGSSSNINFPIETEHDLETYASRVAGTVAELCLGLVFQHSRSPNSAAQRDHLIRAGGRMGIALQYVNIARDIATDAAIGRVYIPTTWLKDAELTPKLVVENPRGYRIERLRGKLLDKAFAVYREAKPALGQLPPEVRAPMRVAVESYMEIGRVLREKGYTVKRGKATVPKLRRLRVAWKALNEG